MYIRKIYKKYIHHHIEKIKWFNILLIFIIFLKNNSLPKKTNLNIVHIVINVLLIIFCICILFNTKIWKKCFIFLQESTRELNNIIVPKKIDSLKTTAIVIIITILLSLILWVLDNFLMHLISWII
ncbi:preprotein translocase subunit SecE [Buchnera aphidicola]|uniref:preprotein translocase subunit SecE n=1 Tax=Buchnera aphidicola TaxID=9 RepID=UPI00094DE92F|nr:preprotein translocase subunit SecE [Buchnera aphidicola]